VNNLFSVIYSRCGLKKCRIYLIFALIVGIAMIFIANRTGEERKSDDVELHYDEKVTDDLPKENTEMELEKILSEMSGAGKIKVMISYESSDEKLVLKDLDGTGGENTVMFSGSSEKEPFIYKSLSPQIGGVIVVAEGGGNIEIKSTIADAVSTILGIPLHKVKVLKMK